MRRRTRVALAAALIITMGAAVSGHDAQAEPTCSPSITYKVRDGALVVTVHDIARADQAWITTSRPKRSWTSFPVTPRDTSNGCAYVRASVAQNDPRALRVVAYGFDPLTMQRAWWVDA